MTEARRFTPETGLYEHIYFAERQDEPTAWTVEAYHHDGAIEQAIFIGPEARAPALAYAKAQYGWDIVA